jgi:hypothetical protein
MNSAPTAEDDGSGIRCNEILGLSQQSSIKIKIGKVTALREYFLVGCVLSQVVLTPFSRFA